MFVLIYHYQRLQVHLEISTDRVQKLKDARTEASKEIEEYKKAKETEFKKFEASVRTTFQ